MVNVSEDDAAIAESTSENGHLAEHRTNHALDQLAAILSEIAAAAVSDEYVSKADPKNRQR